MNSLKSVQRRGGFRRGATAMMAAVVGTALVVAGCSAPSAPDTTDAAGQGAVTVTDDLGREVTLDRPIETAVVANRYNSELIRAMGEIDKVISVDVNTAQDTAYWPMFSEDNTIGKSQSELNLEKIIELDPDVLIVPRNSEVEQYAEKLEPAGIDVLAVTGWDNAEFDKQMDILGTAFGNSEGAETVSTLYQETVSTLEERLKSVEKRKKVYWEYGDPFTTAVPGTSNDGWHNMIVSAGGENIFGDPKFAGDTIDPERILSENPDLVLKVTSGGALKNTGRYTPPEPGDLESIGEDMLVRPGWSDLTAVRNGDVYMMTGFLGGGLGKMVGAAYLAKWLYPDEFADFDPDTVFEKWLDLQGMPVPEGHTLHVGDAAEEQQAA